MTPFHLEWWVYLCMVVCFFVTCLGLNYIVKKINEAKIDERFIRMLQKASTTQSTQVNGPLIPLETSGDRLNSSKTPQRSPLGISLVFNREQNRRKTFVKKLDSFSVSNMSQEKINAIPLPTKRNANDSVSIKTIESKNIVAKHTSSQKLFETNNNDAGVTEVMSFKRNEVPIQEMVALPLKLKDCSKSEVVIENESSLPPRETPPLLHIDNNVSQGVIIEANVVIKQVEETTSNEIDYVKEYVPIKKIYSSLLITKPSFLEIAMKAKASYANKINNEEIDPGIFIKTSLENIASQIANTLKNKTEDPPNIKSATDARRTKPNESPNKEDGERNVIELIPMKTNKSASVGKLVPKRSVPIISLKDVEDIISENLLKKIEDTTLKTTNDDSGNDQTLTVKTTNNDSGIDQALTVKTTNDDSGNDQALTVKTTNDDSGNDQALTAKTTNDNSGNDQALTVKTTNDNSGSDQELTGKTTNDDSGNDQALTVKSQKCQCQTRREIL